MFYVRDLLKNPEVLARIKCSKPEKDSIKGTIDLIMEMAQVSHSQGLIPLKQFTEKTDNVYLKNGINLISAGGLESEVVYDILAVSLLADTCKGKQFLENIIVLNGILCIQNGVNPELIRLLLNSWLYGIYPRK